MKNRHQEGQDQPNHCTADAKPVGYGHGFEINDNDNHKDWYENQGSQKIVIVINGSKTYEKEGK